MGDGDRGWGIDDGGCIGAQLPRTVNRTELRVAVWVGRLRLPANGRDAVARLPRCHLSYPQSPIPHPLAANPSNKHPSAQEDAVSVDGHDLAGGETALG